MAKGSDYERQSLIKEFKRGLSRVLRRRKLAKAENSPSTIKE